MKFPKNRANVYVVVRGVGVVCGVFADQTDADEYCGACAQEWLDKTKIKAEFWVTVSTFYT